MLIRAKHIISLLVLMISMLMYSTELKAQWKLDVKGTVKNEDTKKRFEGVTITIKRNGAVWKTINTPANGEFVLELPPDAVYLVEFSKPGFTGKKIEFSTKNVPPEDAKYGFEFPMEMNLFEEVEGLDVSILDKPIAKVAFDPAYGYMDFDPNYTKSIQKELEQLKKDHEQKRKEQEAARKAKEKEYATVIASADKLFNSKKYAEAKPLYEQAAKLLPSETYPQFQLGLIADELAAANEANARYTTAIERGDKAFSERNWEKAKMEYNAAISYKPDEAYPQNKIKEIDDLIKNKEKIDKEYTDLITSGDAYMINKDYEKAKADFEKAAALKDFEAYPKTKLKEIEIVLAELAKKAAEEKAKQEKYDAAIAAADKALAAKEYDAAKGKYNEALGVKPDEQYPKTKLTEIEGLLAELAKKEAEEKAKTEQYNALISAADKALGAKDYEDAKGKYNEAIVVKPEEKYPKDKIVEIDGILAELAKEEAEEKAKQEKYDAAIAAADKALTEKSYDAAKTKYNEALSLKAEEKYPKDKIVEIDGILAELAKKEAEEKAKQEKYDAAIAAADKALADKSYDAAKGKYNEALGVKPDEQYPKTKLTEIEGLLAELAKKEAAEKANQQKYDAAIAAADKALGAKDYETAKGKYNEALGIKAEEQYPKDKINEIESILAELAKKEAEEKAKQQKYDAAIAAADKALAEKSYEAAKGKYNEALEVKAEEKYPKDKLKEIEGILAEIARKKAEEESAMMAQKEKDEKYNAVIAAADKALAEKSYDAAKGKYNEALGVKPNEQYPKDKLTEIDGILAEIAKKKVEEERARIADLEKTENYNSWIALADKAFNDKSYDQAKEKYNLALGLKPNEQYPKNKINEIEGILAELAGKEAAEKAKQEKYNTLITAADNALSSKNYETAKGKYNEALGIKPDEQYPKNKIKEIDDLLAKLAQQSAETELEKEAEKKKREYYQAVIAQADADFYGDKFDKATQKYQEALMIYPNEEYPKNQLKAIDVAKAKALAEKEKNDKYNALIASADDAFKSENYDQAKVKYKDALALKSSETYPKNQIDEIEKILAAKIKEQITVKPNAQDQKKAEYDSFIKMGDDNFGSKSYETAKSFYKKALSIMPSEAYPQQKIEEINNILAQIAEEQRKNKSEALALKAKREKYDQLIFDADRMFLLNKFENAKDKYKEALVLFEGEQYPKDQLVKIEAMLDKLAKEKEEKEVVVKNNTPPPGSRAKIDDKREKEIEAMMKKIWEDKEKDKDRVLAEDKAIYNKQEEIRVSTSKEKTNKAQEEILATYEQIEKMQKEGDKKYLENEKELQADKASYNKQEEIRIKYNVDKTNEAQDEILATYEQVEKMQKDGDKKYLENEKQLQSDKAYYNQQQLNNIKTANDKTKEAHTYANKQKDNMSKYAKDNEPRYQQKVEELYSYKSDIQEDRWIMIENADKKRQKNQEAIDNQQTTIQQNQKDYEARRKDREIDVKKYSKDLAALEEVRINASLKKVEDNRRELQKYADQIALMQIEQTKKHKAKAEKLAADKLLYMEYNEKRIAEEKQKNDKATAELKDYKTQLIKEQQKYQKDADFKRSKNEQEAIAQKELLNKPTKEQLQRTINAEKQLQKEKQFYTDYQSQLNAKQIEKSTKASEEVYDVYVGEKKLSSNLDQFDKKYPQGITEEERETGNAIVIRRIKVTGDHADVYERIFYKWGGVYYSKNGVSISKNIWDNESIEK
ncbi:MAG: hypothetical protein COA31_001880 [Flavobacteriales bacterium]|nr:hypothetical protein [Flavobacteriales bacterium]